MRPYTKTDGGLVSYRCALCEKNFDPKAHPPSETKGTGVFACPTCSFVARNGDVTNTTLAKEHLNAFLGVFGNPFV